MAGEPVMVPWSDALAYCEDLSLAGRADWRLPDVKELQSIVDYAPSDSDWDTHKMALDTTKFDSCCPLGRT